jgi:hypothetical protein
MYYFKQNTSNDCKTCDVRDSNVVMEKLLVFFLTLFQNTPTTEHSELDKNIFHLFKKKLYTWKHIIPQTHLDIVTNVIFSILVFLTPTTTHFNTLKESNTTFQVLAFDHKAFFKRWFALLWPFTRQGPGIGYFQCSLVYTGQSPGMGCYRCSACAQLLPCTDPPSLWWHAGARPYPTKVLTLQKMPT